MDNDIRFGELEVSPRQRRLRPDQNRHCAVVSCQTPSQDDLPIYVDMDVLREIDRHALSNMDAELGGVLLGGQYEDDQGRSFVVISDSLRAEHYENTKGSFKFTHETWSDITRKRDEFPADTQMVGWYHTHPGWGVFLSGMDTFICSHFFNKPLDVALVIDPCRRERAFFQWTATGDTRTRLTRGFYLTGSRFRLPELEIYATQLEGKVPMPSDPRYSGLPGVYPPTVVQVGEPKQTWLAVAVLGVLTMQFLVLAWIAWRILEPYGVAASQPAHQNPAGAELAAQRAVLDRVIGKLNVAPEGVVQTLEQERQKNEELQSSNLGLLAHVREMTKTQQQSEDQLQSLSRENEQLLTTVDRLTEDRTMARGQLDDLKKKLAKYEQMDGEELETGIALGGARWKWYLGSVIVVVLALVAGAYAYYGPARAGDNETASPLEPPES
jgi:proteasome lid subunit RPN8/RPN11